MLTFFISLYLVMAVFVAARSGESNNDWGHGVVDGLFWPISLLDTYFGSRK